MKDINYLIAAFTAAYGILFVYNMILELKWRDEGESRGDDALP